MAEERTRKRTLVCPNDDTEVELDDEGEGTCSKCGADVSAVYRRDVNERALENLRKRREADDKKGKKSKRSAFNF